MARGGAGVFGQFTYRAKRARTKLPLFHQLAHDQNASRGRPNGAEHDAAESEVPRAESPLARPSSKPWATSCYRSVAFVTAQGRQSAVGQHGYSLRTTQRYPAALRISVLSRIKRAVRRANESSSPGELTMFGNCQMNVGIHSVH